MGHERDDGPGHPRQWVIQRVILQKVRLSKSCNLTRGANFAVNVSSAYIQALPYNIHMHEI